jgi:hypothetical protein
MIKLLATAARSNNLTSEIIPILVILAVLAVCYTITKVMTWNVEPWRRKYLKPRKQFIQDWWRVRIFHLRSRHADVFAAPTPFREQTLDVGKIVQDVEQVVDPHA